MKKRNQGISLIEVVIYVAIVAVVLGAMVSVGLGAVKIRGKNAVEQEVIAASRLVMKRISWEIRGASGINSVGAQSISLANSDSLRNPTVISYTNGRISIGYGSAGSCPTSSPCFLTSDDVVVSKLLFDDMSNGSSWQSIKFEVAIKKDSGGGQNYAHTIYATGSAEVRSK